MFELFVYDRSSKKVEKEKIYGRAYLEAFYGKGFFPLILSKTLLPIVATIPLFSWIYGLIQKSGLTKKKVKAFIKKFHVDASEFEKEVGEFTSFNDFFIRKLKKGTRPIIKDHHLATLPADGRYLVFQNLDKTESFFVKGKRFNLATLLKSEKLAKRYHQGSMVIARLCPTDYHRFHFPIDCVPDDPVLINGPLYSVNPIALSKNIDILAENKRMVTTLHTKEYGRIVYVEIGATYVGSIHQTYTPFREYKKGDEKGFFSFGGSCLVLLFEKDVISFDQDLIQNSAQFIETKALMGGSLGVLKKKV